MCAGCDSQDVTHAHALVKYYAGNVIEVEAQMCAYRWASQMTTKNRGGGKVSRLQDTYIHYH